MYLQWMLTFLRKIRRSLIESGSARKYILYAIGEIMLVVIGILIALQINNWNEERKERKMEKIVLEDIHDNIVRNNQLILSALQVFQEIDRSTVMVKNTLKTNSPYFDSLSHHFSYAIRHGGFLLRLNSDGYESLKNAGFDIIQNEKLKDEILSLFEATYSKYLVELEWGNGTYAGFYGWWDDYFYTTEKDELVPIDYNQILKSKTFLSKINEANVVREEIKQSIYNCLTHNNDVLQLIKVEMEE